MERHAVKERFVARRSSPDVTGPAYINLETIFRLGSTPPTTGTFMFGYLAALWSLIVRLQKSRPSRETRGDLKSTRGSQIAAGIMIIYSLKNSWQRRQGALAYSHLGSAMTMSGTNKSGADQEVLAFLAGGGEMGEAHPFL